jgi:tetratricopeptide (TPR) repeat protein
VTRLVAVSVAFFCVTQAQQSTSRPNTGVQRKTTEAERQVNEPPEEDESLIVKECVLNPLEAKNNIVAGDFYYKKSKYGAAANRYRSAACWDPSSAEAFLKLGQADEKLHNRDGERDAYHKYLALAPKAKNAAAIEKKLAKLPPSPTVQ